MAKNYSARVPKTLPTVNRAVNPQDQLAAWQASINKSVQQTAPAAPPFNFRVTNTRSGLQLSWSPVQSTQNPKLGGPDGYEIIRSGDGTFTDDVTVIPIPGANQSGYFDSTGGSVKTYHYRIRTTSGTQANPQSQRGPDSGAITHTSIDATDTTSTSVTISDNYTTDKIRSQARFGNYGTSLAYKTSLGKVGGSAGTPSGQAAGGSGSTTTPTPAAGVVTFDQIGTGTNNSAVMFVSAGAVLDVDSAQPGIIDCTNIQGIGVDTVTPTDGQVLAFSAATGLYEPITLPTSSSSGSGSGSGTTQVTNGSAAAPNELADVLARQKQLDVAVSLLNYEQVAQAATLSVPQNGFVPRPEIPAFLGG